MGVPIQGFYTEEVRAEGRRTGFDVVALDGSRGKLARVGTDSMSDHRSRYSVGQYSVLLEDFEKIALPVLQVNTDKGAVRPVYVIDEIGKMEMFSSSFVQTVRRLLAHDVGTTVLATIPIAKGRPIPLVEELRHSTDAKLVMISRVNREEVVAEVVQSVLDAHGHT